MVVRNLITYGSQAHNEGSDPISGEEEIKLKNIIREIIKEVREERQ